MIDADKEVAKLDEEIKEKVKSKLAELLKKMKR